MAAARCFRGDRAALTALRLRRVVSFLRRHRLYDTAHEYARSLASSPLSAAIALPVFDRSTPIPSTDAAVCRLERRTGAFFDVAHFRRLLGYFRWADASSYALGFVTPGRCSREADALIARILIFRLLDDLDGGRTYGVDALFQRIDASLDSDGHHLRKVLLAIRSDRARCFSCSSNLTDLPDLITCAELNFKQEPGAQVLLFHLQGCTHMPTCTNYFDKITTRRKNVLL